MQISKLFSILKPSAVRTAKMAADHEMPILTIELDVKLCTYVNLVKEETCAVYILD
jgi:hypothetical protein